VLQQKCEAPQQMETTSGNSVINRPTDWGRAESQSKAGMISYISFGWTSSFLLNGRRRFVPQ